MAARALPPDARRGAVDSGALSRDQLDLRRLGDRRPGDGPLCLRHRPRRQSACSRAFAVAAARAPHWLTALIGLLIVLTRPEGVLMAGVARRSPRSSSDYRTGRPGADADDDSQMGGTGSRCPSRCLDRVASELLRRVAAQHLLRQGQQGRIHRPRLALLRLVCQGLVLSICGVPSRSRPLLLRDLVSRCHPRVFAAAYILYTIWVGGDWMGYRFYHHLLAAA